MEWSSEIWQMATGSTLLIMIFFLFCFATAVPLVRYIGFRLKLQTFKNLPLTVDALDQKIGGPSEFLWRTNKRMDDQQTQRQQQQQFFQPTNEPRIQTFGMTMSPQSPQQTTSPTATRKDKSPKKQKSTYVTSQISSSPSSTSSSSRILSSTSSSPMSTIKSPKRRQQRRKRSPRRHTR
ncbi:uncharacterized protein LOC124499423 [Dermatophagoides farinae]|uniref:uncharacterized protein LOC124499423 n=1 Tax=Dermatophagoides farinae TaxID=6954 RepID=UPI003F6185A1